MIQEEKSMVKQMIASHRLKALVFIVILITACFIGLFIVLFYSDEKEQTMQQIVALRKERDRYELQALILQNELASVSAELERIKQEDQRKINQELKEELEQIRSTYQQTIQSYEEILKIRELSRKTQKLDEQFATILVLLGKRDYKTAQEKLRALSQEIYKINDYIAKSSQPHPTSAKESNTPPGYGYSRQVVSALGQQYMVDIVAGDLSSTRVIVDTASSNDCRNECPVLSLAEYVSRNGAYAGINGSYFCPSSYPSCAGKTNSFDTLLMNKDKVYFNSENNVYSVVPAVIFLGNSVRFVQKSLEWGRDTGIDSMIANQGLLVFGGDIAYGDDGDPKKGSRGPRSFVANKGALVYIGVTHNATVAENAHVMKTLGMDNALNLDSGGSTALWYGGYKVGPGRNIPNAILFVRR